MKMFYENYWFWLWLLLIISISTGPTIKSMLRPKCDICGHKDYPRNEVAGMTESFVICRKCAQAIYDQHKTKETDK